MEGENQVRTGEVWKQLNAGKVPAGRCSQLVPSVVQLGATGGRCVIWKNSNHPSEALHQSNRMRRYLTLFWEGMGA